MTNAYCEQATKAKSGGAWLELLISGLVVYIVAAGAGLVFIMFPDATRQVFGNVRQSFLQYMPQSSKPRLPVIQPPAEVEQATVTKPVPRPARARPAITTAKRKFGVQVIDATRPESPIHLSEPATVSFKQDATIVPVKARRRSSPPPQ